MNQVLKQKILVLPTHSGVYVMKDKGGNVIYVGKAKNLKNRVSQYFQNSVKHEKVKLMVENIFDMDYFVVPGEHDAFVLERNLIAKYQPFFNILLKDGKQYPYLKIDLSKEFPKIEVTRRVKADKAKYFGPYLYPIKAEELIKIVNYAFPLRTCSLKINQQKPQSRGCLNFDLGLCCAPCANKITKDEYMKILKRAMRFLSGDSAEMLEILTNKMQTAAQAENFEVALELKNKISMVKKLEDKVITQLTKTSNFDVLGAFEDGVFVSTCVMQIRGGKLLNVECFNLVNLSDDKKEILQNFICEYYYQQVIPAKDILVGFEVSQSILEQFFLEKKGVNVNIIRPQKGMKYKLVEMANLNAQKYVERSVDKDKNTNLRTLGAISRLQEKLNLKTTPTRIECFDISHLSGEETVASMTVFINGEKAKKFYRKFKIRTVDGINDFDSMKEVISRRVDEYQKQKDISFSQKPNLIVVDGGKGQLSSACAVLEGFDVDVISLAEKFDEVFVPNTSGPIMLKRGSVELRLLQNIRDEAHRFAITFNRNNRLKKVFKSPLLEVAGIGEVTAKNLTKAYSTIANMKGATKEELLKISGVNSKNIENLMKFLKNN